MKESVRVSLGFDEELVDERNERGFSWRAPSIYFNDSGGENS